MSDDLDVATASGRDLEALRAWFNAWPGARLMEVECTALGNGTATVEMRPPREFRNPNGAIHGGLTAALADQAGGLAVSTMTTPEEYTSTIHLGVQYLLPAMTIPMRGVGRVQRRGRHVAFASVELIDGDGRVCGAANGTWAVYESEHVYG